MVENTATHVNEERDRLVDKPAIVRVIEAQD